MRLLILGLLLAIGLGSYVSFRYLADREAQRQVHVTSLDTRKVLASYIHATQDTTRLQLDDLSEQAVFKNATIVVGEDFTIKDRLSTLAQGLNLDGIAVAFGDNRPARISAGWPSKAKVDRRLPGVSQALAGKPWSGIIAEDTVISRRVVVPITFGDGSPGALVGIKVFDRELANTLCFSRPDRALVFYINGRPAQTPITSDSGTKLVNAESRDMLVTETNAASGTQKATSGGRTYLGAYTALPGVAASDNMGMIAYNDYNALVAPLREMSNIFLALLFGMLVVGLFLGEQLTVSLTRPLEQVVRAAKSMQRGEQPASFETLGRSDEIGTLQRVFNDMVEAVERNRKLLLGMIEVDPLTELKNHRSLQERIGVEYLHARQANRPLSLILLDLDDFKTFNQSHGLAGGDEMLKRVALRLRRVCQPPTVVARYGGDEFAVLVPGLSLVEVEALANEIHLELGELEDPIRCSVGIGDADLAVENPNALVLSAELAMRRSKQLGGNRVSRLGGSFDVNDDLLSDYFMEGSLATVRALAAAVDAKDPYTNGHSERVAVLARDLATRMQCSPTFVELLYGAGTLHDVGKIGIPDAILTKRESLTPEEIQIMETHPVMGEVIVGKVPHLAQLLPGVRHHHERWDGGGYPDRLAGEEIPLLARFLAVADTFDAMTSERPYRRALSEEVALEEIARCAGTQFEPRIAVAFVAMVREMRRTVV